ncbi:hypothetical protein FQZ97_618620 [compost metagenome]
MDSADTASAAPTARIQPLRPHHHAAQNSRDRVTNTGSSSAPSHIHDQGVKCA